MSADGPMRIDDHEHQKRYQEDDSAYDGDAIEVLLYDAGTRLGGVHGTGDSIRDARSLPGMHEDEDDESDAGKEQQHQEYDHERCHASRFFLP